MKKLQIIFLVITLLSGCTHKTGQKSKRQRQNILQHAKNLHITLKEDHALVELTNPSNNKTYRYCVSKNEGIKAPPGYTSILAPVRSIIAFSGTETGMLTKLNAIDKISAVSDQRFIYSKTLLKRIQQGKVMDFKGNQTNAFERIVACKSSLLIFSGFEEDFPKSKQLKSLGTLCIPNYDWKEKHPLGKAEWIIFMGVLIGKEKEAIHYFEGIKKDYVRLVKQIKQYKNKPSVFCGNLLGDTWFSPAGESYNAKLIADAGGSYVYSKSEGIGSLSLSMERIYKDNKHTQIWLNPGIHAMEQLLQNNPKMSLFDCVKNKQVYCYSHNMNKFWELSAIEPQKLLGDLIKIFNRNAGNKDDLYFYQKVSATK